MITLTESAASEAKKYIESAGPESFLRIRQRLGLTAIFVTHDMVEALLLGDRIAVMHRGRLVQIGTPSELLQTPADDYVRQLMDTPRRQAELVEGLLAAGPS